MAKIERVRETWSRPITAEYLAQQASFGWKLVSVVWEREIEPDPGGHSPRQEDPPYGLRVAGDGGHLEENNDELEVALVIMEAIGRDTPPTLLDSGQRFRRIERRIHHLHAVQPVLHVVAAQHNARVIELTYGARGRLRRSHHVIECAGGVLLISFCVGIR